MITSLIYMEFNPKTIGKSSGNTVIRLNVLNQNAAPEEMNRCTKKFSIREWNVSIAANYPSTRLAWTATGGRTPELPDRFELGSCPINGKIKQMLSLLLGFA
jgi:hypothetical protein